MKPLLSMLTLLMLSSSALAEPKPEYSTATRCPKPVEHKPDADVEYKAGQDAKGWAVEPADMYPPAIDPEKYKEVHMNLDIPVTNYVKQEKYNADLSQTFIRGGELAVTKDTVTLDGQDLKGEGDRYYHPDCAEPETSKK